MSVVFDWKDRQFRLALDPGERLLDACDNHPQTGTVFSCRSAHCGTCLVELVAGAALVLPATTGERETLSTIGATGAQRLACQIRAGTASGGVGGEVELTSVRGGRCEPAD